MPTYFAYGLGIHSALQLPELVEGDFPADVSVLLRRIDYCPERIDDSGHGFAALRQGACYSFKDAGKYLVRDGREVIVDPLPWADESVIRLSLLGPALGLALIQRGRLVMHASAVAVAGDRGVAFLGSHGWGKSTLAATLHFRGHPMLADDVVAIDLGDEGEGAARRPKIAASFARFKLWPDAAKALGRSVGALPKLHPAHQKVGLQVGGIFPGAEVPLEHLYLLGKGPDVESEPIAPQEALKVIMEQWYGTRFGQGLLAATDLAAHFKRCVRLAGSVPLSRLRRPRTDGAGMELAEAIERVILHDLS